MAGGDDKGAIALFGGGRSKPLSLSLAGVYALSREFSRLGAIMLFSFVCEHYPFFPHAAKSHDMDMFWSLTAALFIAAAFTMRRSKSTDLLHREQTEEWKGWMQFMFLLYHYLHAGEVYNAIRVMITCYVWMTGFGNFSFFYIKDDFSAVRVLQMLWRLNFLVGLLMLVHGNTYILYYICPLHTFYFLMTYVVMRVGRGLNRTKWGIRAKIMAVAAIIFLVWDTRLGLFDVLFGWVGATPKMGGTAGTLYEWYFRTSLDHYSTILGMVFALNYPVTKAFFDSSGALPAPQKAAVIGVGNAGALGVLAFWFVEYYTLPKVPYNATNAYMAPVALLCYIFLRNALPVMRSYHSELLHDIGKTTLETYLLQHHLWLTSNAKTLLVLVPGMPKLNFLLVSCVYYGCAKECYRLTMSLRGMFLPDGDVRRCVRNLIGLAAVVGAALGAGAVLTMNYLSRAEHLIAVLAIGLVVGFGTLLVLDRLPGARHRPERHRRIRAHGAAPRLRGTGGCAHRARPQRRRGSPHGAAGVLHGYGAGRDLELPNEHRHARVPRRVQHEPERRRNGGVEGARGAGRRMRDDRVAVESPRGRRRRLRLPHAEQMGGYAARQERDEDRRCG
mmetsp:Transcript_42104/g.131836  ORF Transcript_42104/g.131836 Transcript_42104/m.131836 type:complete len:614 (-) Transcript_42104:1776-3617(-)